MSEPGASTPRPYPPTATTVGSAAPGGAGASNGSPYPERRAADRRSGRSASRRTPVPRRRLPAPCGRHCARRRAPRAKLPSPQAECGGIPRCLGEAWRARREAPRGLGPCPAGVRGARDGAGARRRGVQWTLKSIFPLRLSPTMGLVPFISAQPTRRRASIASARSTATSNFDSIEFRRHAPGPGTATPSLRTFASGASNALRQTVRLSKGAAFTPRRPPIVICRTLRRRAGALSERRITLPTFAFPFISFSKTSVFNGLRWISWPPSPCPLARAAAGISRRSPRLTRRRGESLMRVQPPLRHSPPKSGQSRT